MKALMLVLVLVAAGTAAQEPGRYYLDRSLNKTVVTEGSRKVTVPEPKGSGTTFVYVKKPEPRKKKQ